MGERIELSDRWQDRNGCTGAWVRGGQASPVCRAGRGEMMERLVTVKDMQERYGCSLPTARKYLRQMIPHMENPLTATVTAFREWEEKRMRFPTEMTKAQREQHVKKSERTIVPRKR